MVDLEEVESDEEVLEHLPTRKSAAINESFQVAKEAWIILHSIETFEKGIMHRSVFLVLLDVLRSN